MQNEPVWSLIQVALFSFVPLIVWFITARRKESFFLWIGFSRPVCGHSGKMILLTVIAALGYISAMTICIKLLPEGVTTAGSQFAGQSLSALLSVFFYAVLRTALSEEILFRGFILKRIQNRYGFTAGNMVQALLFGLLHGVPFGIATKSAAAFPLLTLMPGLLGWYQGRLNKKSCGGSILPSWLLHSCMNLITGILSL
ncbi:MAG: CPBP family intramembrane metalloprotease [Clostridia bacterium]|nr:CPBP family intramembrane metalloprotease [Clostridia bacterium]